MTPTTPADDRDPPPDGSAAVLLLDRDGVVLRCAEAVPPLDDRPLAELPGRRVTEIAADPDAWTAALAAPGPARRTLRTALLREDGSTLDVDAVVTPLPPPPGARDGDARFVVRVAPAVDTPSGGGDEALLRALFGQHLVGLIVHATDLRIIRANHDPRLLRRSRFPDGEQPPDLRLTDILVARDAAAIEERLRHVLDTGESLIGWERRARYRISPGRERVVSLSAFRLHDSRGRVTGVAVVFTDVTESHTSRRRLGLLYSAATRLGRTLDMTHNARELASLLASDFADLASVDLSEGAIRGEDAGSFGPGAQLRRVAAAAAEGEWPEDIHQRGETIRAPGEQSEAIREESEALLGGRAVLVPDLAAWREDLGADAERRRLLFPAMASSALFVPLHARGGVLGVLALWRGGDSAPFTESDVPLIEEIASRASLALENARRYTTELRTVESLQRSLLPPSRVALSAAESSGLYVPADNAQGIGGCWYDVIELPAARVAFVIGDVAGHGLAAAATMGRLRTAVQTLSDLELPPEELLTHLDDLVVRLGADEPESRVGGVLGSTCLYCVYDPVTGHCVMAGAGHPPPVLITADGEHAPVPLTPGPALGTGHMPFESLDLTLAPGSVLAFPTQELVRDEGRSRRLREALAEAVAAGETPAATGRAALDRALTEPPADDVALLVAGVRLLPPGSTATWRLKAEPSVVGEARRLIAVQLAEWGLEELAFTTELIVSELITNAIRYAEPPLELRLIKDESLICEVSDASQTQPRMRPARLMDEGGRGLFLIAQVAHRWGSRYTRSGKTIWAEQPLLPG
ncbi:SpoIIE family protein phosphatase [Streptomyces sp. SID8352]|uniref:SpoIIE family protein phosphatase n=1 Tax=Streptomyces sp. SID8352 TaxID=2690338 RepID=UPI00136F4E84|nr:SpoIIE family protein phosphatase [Streptomyces sp. SID8352]